MAQWKFTADGKLVLAADSTLALGFSGTDPSSGKPHVVLVKLTSALTSTLSPTGSNNLNDFELAAEIGTPSSESVDVATFKVNGAQIVVASATAKGAKGACLDVTAHNEKPGAPLQVTVAESKHFLLRVFL
jgi:hypothetical protein